MKLTVIMKGAEMSTENTDMQLNTSTLLPS